MLAYLVIKDPKLALIFVFCRAGDTVFTSAGQIWYPRDGKRTDLKLRARGHGMVSVMEFVVIAGWGATAWTLSVRPVWAPLALLVAGLASSAVWLLGRARREDDRAGNLS